MQQAKFSLSSEQFDFLTQVYANEGQIWKILAKFAC
jgi:hypothetical protein